MKTKPIFIKLYGVCYIVYFFFRSVVHLDFGLRLEDQPDHGRLLRPALRHQVSQVEVQPADLPKNCRTINSRKMNNLSSTFAYQDF